MAKLTKKVKAVATYDKNLAYAMTDAVSMVKGAAKAKFDESVDVAGGTGCHFHVGWVQLRRGPPHGEDAAAEQCAA